MRGPLDVLKENWVGESVGDDENILSYVMLMRERLDAMTELVQMSLGKARQVQKKWYDRTARIREFSPGDDVLVLIPTTGKRLLAQWQGPYSVVHQVEKVNYKVDMHDRQRRNWVFHVNMLKKFYPPEAADYWVQECVGWIEEKCVEDDDDMPGWKCEEGDHHLLVTPLVMVKNNSYRSY